MSWFILYDDKSGRMVSQGTIVAERLPEGVVLLELLGRPPDSDMWDPATLRFVPRPAKVLKDVYDDVLAEFRGRGLNVPPPLEAALKQALIDVVGNDRFYSAASGWTKRDE